MGDFDMPEDVLDKAVTVFPKQGNSAFGPVFGASYSAAAYLEPREEMVTDERGQTVLSTLFGLFRSAAAIRAGYEIEWGDARYRVVRVDAFTAPGGDATDVEVRLGSVAR